MDSVIHADSIWHTLSRSHQQLDPFKSDILYWKPNLINNLSYSNNKWALDWNMNLGKSEKTEKLFNKE